MDIISDEKLYYEVVGRTITTQYFTISGVVILAWDWLTHIDDEIKLIWMQDWTLAGKPLYLFLRYAGLAFQVYDMVSMLGIWNRKFCLIYYQLLPVGTAVFLYLIDILLAYRVVCLYNQKSRLFFIANFTALLASIITTIAICCLAIPLYDPIPTPKHLTGCWSVIPGFSFLSLAPPIIFELWIFILAIYKILLYWREYKGASRIFVMAKLLLRDQVNWFFIITAFILWSISQSSLAPTGLRGIALPFFRSFVSICGCRLVLHIRQTYFDHNLGEEQTLTVTQGVVNSYGPRFGLPPLSSHFQSLWPEDEGDEGDMNPWDGNHESNLQTGDQRNNVLQDDPEKTKRTQVEVEIREHRIQQVA